MDEVNEQALDAGSDAPDTTTADDLAKFHVDRGTDIVVRVDGELDAQSGSRLRTLLAQAFDDRPDAVIVDLDQVEFIDSVGLSVLVTAHNRGSSGAVRFSVRSPSTACMRVFEITGLVEILDIV